MIIFPCQFIEMNLSIELNGQSFGVAVKVQYIVADAVLTSELSAGEVGVFKNGPETSLGRCEIAAKLLAAVF